jgi:rsbT antagonist protein RsbS
VDTSSLRRAGVIITVSSGRGLVPILRQGPYLFASVHTALDDTEMIRFRHDLAHDIGRYRSTGVIIDVAPLDVLDSFAFTTLRTIAHMTPLQGAITVIVGIKPDVALALVRLGTSAGPVATALDLESGVEYLARHAGQHR